MKTKGLWIVTLIPTIITAIVIQFLPDKVPMHYNIHGEIDRWGSKYENFLFPGMTILFTVFWVFLIWYFNKRSLQDDLDEKLREDAKSNAMILGYMAIGVTVLFGIIQCFVLLFAYTNSKNSASTLHISLYAITTILIGILMMIFGILMPQTKINSIVGVRTGWSMKNDNTWNYSNKYGGIVFMITGLLIILAGCIVSNFGSIMIMLGLTLIATVIIVVISYLAYLKYPE
jgi:uncharacterized membrane protein